MRFENVLVLASAKAHGSPSPRISEGKASTSFLQRKLQIGYNRAARIIDMMEEKGIVSKANHVGKREVL